MGFNRGKKGETAGEVERVHGREAMKVSEAQFMGEKDGVAFDYQVVDDEKILMLFEPYLGTDENGNLIENPNYTPALKPLLPFISRLCYLTNCSQLAAEIFVARAHYQIMLAKTRVKNDEDYDTLESLKAWIEMRVNDSINGEKLKRLTERRKYVEVAEGRQKKGLFRR